MMGINIDGTNNNDFEALAQKIARNINNNIKNPEYLSLFYNNIISYIHFNEFAILM
jgi:hypothetical protein